MTTRESADKHFDFAIQIARDALKAILYINAGAAGALIALTDKTHGKPDYTNAIMAFGIGALFAVVAYALGYFSQVNYADHLLERVNGNEKAANQSLHRHNGFQYSAIASAAVGVIGAATGIVIALHSART